MTLDEARNHIGASVVYNPEHGIPEDGDIVCVNDYCVFVLYTGDRTPKGTLPGALTLAEPPTQSENLF